MIVLTIELHEPVSDRALDQYGQSVQAVLTGPGASLVIGASTETRQGALGSVLEAAFTVLAASELHASRVADRVRELLQERAVSRLLGEATFGRPIQLTG